MDMLIKAAVVGIVGALLSIVVKKNNPEMALLLILATGMVVLVLAMDVISNVQEIISLATEISGLSPAILSPVLKCIGIGIITRLSVDLCKDAGAGAIASSVELLGAGAALIVSIPLMQTLIQMIGGIL